MRSMWAGAIAFGLVNVPVKLYAAASSHDVPLHQVHDADGGRIRYQRRCEVCGEVVAYEHIDRAYEADGKRVVLTEEELEALPAEAAHEIQVLQFVPSEQIDPLTLGAAYYLEPDKKAAKPYLLLRSTLEQTARTAVVKYALRQRTRLGVLRVRGDLMVLQSLLWADEVREPEFAGKAPTAAVTEAEQAMANLLVAQLSEDFDPAAYVDDYQVQLKELVEARLAADEGVIVAGPAPSSTAEEGGEVIDLMAALRASLERKRGGADKGAADAGGANKVV
ncbi:Ku protein [Raineyella sp. LH-20]|uniref:non-homologous end joining protein Ku n=1 Tax=Raineyella sp. LH-20 TaxID=3081204 RepID=UPI002953D37E|nr:Ku protein [Raineyella sp. LH-20]WOP18046.1 Ku protein [Raineyella sp. LH-20]